MSHKDHKEELLGYQDLWDQAVQANIFPPDPRLVPQPDGAPDDDYYANLDREAGLLSEEKGDDSANPIYPDSVGPDSKPKTPWMDVKDIEEIAALRRKLYELECKLNSREAGGTKWQPKAGEPKSGPRKEIEALKGRIDKLSNSLGLKDEPSASLYRTK